MIPRPSAVWSRRGRRLGEQEPEPLFPGLCVICGSDDGFRHTTDYAPREGYACGACGSTSRDRALIYVLGLCLGQYGPLAQWDDHRDLTVLETSGYRGHPHHLAQRFRYVNLIYGSPTEGCILGDITQLPVRDSSIHIVLSSDVFEHVRDDSAGFAEIARVLAPRGYLLLQAPAIGEFSTTQTRVRAHGDRDEHLLPPQYHAENTLVYRVYGDDIVERLHGLGFSVMTLRIRVPVHAITEQTTLIAQKAPFLSMGPRTISDRCWT